MTNLTDKDVVWHYTSDGPVETQLTDQQRNTGKLILPKLSALYEGWMRNQEAAARREHYPTPFTEWARGKEVGRFVRYEPGDSYDERFLYASLAISRHYFIHDHEFTLEVRGGCITVARVWTY